MILHIYKENEHSTSTETIGTKLHFIFRQIVEKVQIRIFFPELSPAYPNHYRLVYFSTK